MCLYSRITFAFAHRGWPFRKGYKSEIRCLSPSICRLALSFLTLEPFTQTPLTIPKMFTKKHSLLGLCVLSSTSSFAQGKSQATTRVSEVSVMHSNKVSHVDPVPASTSSSVESSLDIEAHQPVSITTMKPAPASGLSTCESSAAPGCGLVAITPAATAFDVSTSSAEPTVGSAIAPCAAVSETGKPLCFSVSLAGMRC